MRTVFVLNTGSSSIKYRVVDAVTGRAGEAGIIERIGEPGSDAPDHAAALELIRRALGGLVPDAVGHRIVHGGTLYTAPTLIDDAVESGIESLSPLAPLHNPPGLLGIRAARAAWPEVPQVAVFDTAFHGNLPAEASQYAIDAALATKHGIRRYGFHGTSFASVSTGAAAHLGRPLAELRMIVLHLGNGASAAAIAGGRSIDTSMGLTPLEGLVMGTRSGDIDPAVLPYLHRVAGMGFDELDELLNRRSGLLGLGGSSDMRETTAAAEKGSEAAALALAVYVHRLRHYIGAYAAQLGGLDALVFTGGVGENSAIVRALAVERLGFLGIALDEKLNARGSGPRTLSPPHSAVAVLVIPTDEEAEIARQTAELLDGQDLRLSGRPADPRSVDG
ncbi:MAG: acetate/propionate family kinase [Pseudolysinimonas sp.]